ncbi:MAG: DNA translocase FtsK 4TM domain-containing protein [Blastocatellia bacterium]
MQTATNNSMSIEKAPTRFNEAIGVVLLAFSLTVILSLFSYDPQDPSWNVVSDREQAANWIGSLGAYIADFLFQIFGLSAFLVPVLLTTLGWRTLRLREIRFLHRRFIGLLLILLSIAGLFSLPQMPFYRENVQFGGAIGTLIAQLLETQLNKTGTGIALIVLLVFSLMLITELSINAVLESAGVKAMISGFNAFTIYLREKNLATKEKLFAIRSSWKEHRLAQKKAKEDREKLRQQLREEEAAKREKERTARLKEGKIKITEENLKTNSIEVNKKSSINVNGKVKTAASSVATAVVENNRVPIAPPVQKTASAVVEPVGVVRNVVKQPIGANNFVYGNKAQPDLAELHRLVYGDDQRIETLEEFSLSGALAPLPDLVINQAHIVTQNAGEGVVNPVRRPSDTARVPQQPARVAKSQQDTAPAIAKSAIVQSSFEQEIDYLGNDNSNSTSNENGEIVINRRVNTDEQNVPTPVVSKVASKVAKVSKSIAFSPLPAYELPGFDMLATPAAKQFQADEDLRERAHVLVEKFKEFSVTGEVTAISPGPVVTTFEFKPDPGVKYSRITGLTEDLCLALEAESVRIDRMPGKSTVGIEVPNNNREIIYLREIFESDKYENITSPLALALGKSIDGATYVADLAKMPHLLIAGATGTGKSVCLNSVIVSLLYKASPDDVKMIMVDPKRLELGLYEGIPHLLTPIVLDPKRASNALKWAVGEMERRYKLLAGYSVRNIAQYNQQVRQEWEIIPALHPDRLRKPLPYIVIIIDELADLMMVASNDVETSITRLAQMARAVGIHLIIATQRPSVDVITGLIKANFPSRISFRVSSKVDSRTILDGNGAETLLGQGDMLFLPPGTSRLVRVHGAYVGEREIEAIVDHIRSQRQPDYDESIQSSEEEDEFGVGMGEKDEFFDDAVRVVCQMGKASTSVLQRRLRIGYGRAAAIIDMMEREGLVGPPDGSKPRVVKQSAYDYIERLDQMKEE